MTAEDGDVESAIDSARKLAQARGDGAAYRDYADRYLTIAKSAGLEGHMARAEPMV